jgi:hypothetical protein
MFILSLERYLFNKPSQRQYNFQHQESQLRVAQVQHDIVVYLLTKQNKDDLFRSSIYNINMTFQ